MEQQEVEKALAPIDKEGQLEIRIAPSLDPTQQSGLVWCSQIPESDLDRVSVMAAFQGAIPKLATIMGNTILVKNVGRQQVMLTDDKTGEVFPAVRTVLFTSDGKAYAAVSEGVSASLGMIFKLWKWPPWDPPLPLVLRELPRPGAKRWHYLEVDKEALGKSAKRR